MKSLWKWSLLVAVPMLLTGCPQDGGRGQMTDTFTEDTGDGDGDGDEDGGELCLLSNCQEDAHCGGCTQGRNTCDLDTNRCVACDPDNPTEGCGPDEYCTQFGYCVPQDLDCTVDEEGEPNFDCDEDADCAACDPNHQICDPATNRCVGCTDDNALQALRTLAAREGILCALESAHAVAEGLRRAALPNAGVVVVNLSGRGDKDLAHAMQAMDVAEVSP